MTSPATGQSSSNGRMRNIPMPIDTGRLTFVCVRASAALRERCGRYRLPAGAGSGAAAAPATGGLPPIGRGQAAPESPSSPATPPQLLAVNLTPPHEFPQRVAVMHGIGEGRNGPARRGAPLKPYGKLSQHRNRMRNRMHCD